MVDIDELINSVKELYDILKLIKEKEKKLDEIDSLEKKVIIIKEFDNAHKWRYEKEYENFTISIGYTYLTIYMKNGEVIDTYEGRITLKNLLKFMKYKDKIVPVLKEDLAKQNEELDKTIDKLKKAITALELAGFEVQ